MDNVEELGYQMHYTKLMDSYNDICEKFNIEMSDVALHTEDIKGGYSIRYFILKTEFKKAIESVVLPTWEEALARYFPAEELGGAIDIMRASFDVMPEESYLLFKKTFRTLHLLSSGQINDIKEYIAGNIRFMSLDEIIMNYDYLFRSNFGKELLEGIYSEIASGVDVLPEVKEYFEARKVGSTQKQNKKHHKENDKEIPENTKQ